MNEDKCPVCGSDEFTAIDANDCYGNASLHVWGCGKVVLNGCLKCGVVYIPNRKLEGARKYHDQT